MQEVLKKAQKAMGKKLYKDIKGKFPSKNKFRGFCKRHQNAPKDFFEQKLASFDAKPEKKEEKKEEAKAEA